MKKPPQPSKSSKPKPPKVPSRFPSEDKGKELVEFISPLSSNDDPPAALPSLLAAYHPWSFSSYASEMSISVPKATKKRGADGHTRDEYEVAIEKKSRNL